MRRPAVKTRARIRAAMRVTFTTDVANLPKVVPLCLDGGGLSHVCDHFEHEVFVPSGAFEFGFYGCFFVWVGSRNIERRSSEYGEIGWSIVLATACVVFVADNIEHPMPLVLDAPMLAHNLQKPGGRVVLTEKIVPFHGLFLAALACDHGERLQARKVQVRCPCFGRGHVGDTAFFAPMGDFLAHGRSLALLLTYLGF